MLALPLSGQQRYKSINDIKDEWGDYTNFQRDEMVSFCDFLFKEKHYERCLLTSFQFLYRFPNDPLRPAILFYIARCYEGLENYKLAHRYYQQVISLESEHSNVYRASMYRNIYIDLLSGNSKNIINAIITAKKKNLYTFAILGFNGGKCKKIVNNYVHYKINDMQISEDMQMIVLNMCIQELMKKKL